MSSWTKEAGGEGGGKGGGNGTRWRLRHHHLFACILIGHAATSYVCTTVPVTNPVQGGGVRLQDKANRECFPLPWREASRHLGSMHTMAMALMTLDGHAACSSARPAASHEKIQVSSLLDSLASLLQYLLVPSTLSWHSLSTTRLRSESPLAISPVDGFPESRTPEHTS